MIDRRSFLIRSGMTAGILALGPRVGAAAQATPGNTTDTNGESHHHGD